VCLTEAATHSYKGVDSCLFLFPNMAEQLELEQLETENVDLFDALANGVDPNNGDSDDDIDIIAKPQEKEVEKAEVADEQKKDKTEEVKEEVNVDDLVSKAESGEALTEEEIAAIKAAGYEFEDEEIAEEKKVNEKEDVKPTEFEYNDVLSELYPDESFESDDEKKEALKEFVREEIKLGRQLSDVFSKAPELSMIIKDITAGIDPAVAMLKHLDLSQSQEPDKDDPDYEKFIEAKIQRRIRQQEIEKEKEQVKQNFEKSGKKAQEFATQLKLNDEQKSTFYNAVNGVITNITKGNIDTDIYNLVAKGLAYDGDMKKFKMASETKEAKRIIKIRRDQQKGDGLPRLKSTKIVPKGRNTDPMLDAIGKAVRSNTTNWGL
jgi:hypothetical protein